MEACDWFGTSGSVPAGPVRALIAVSPAGTTVAAESHGVGEDRVGVEGAAGQDGCAVFHLVVGTASLDKEARAEYVPHVAVLFTQTQGSTSNTFQVLENSKLYLESLYFQW